jgi:hypothetical protein
MVPTPRTFASALRDTAFRFQSNLTALPLGRNASGRIALAGEKGARATAIVTAAGLGKVPFQAKANALPQPGIRVRFMAICGEDRLKPEILPRGENRLTLQLQPGGEDRLKPELLPGGNERLKPVFQPQDRAGTKQ